MKRFEIFFGLIRIPFDFIMTMLAFLAAYELRLITEPIKGIAKPIDITVLPTLREYLNFSTNLALALVIIFAIGKLYTLKTTHRFNKEAKKIFSLSIIWGMFILSYFFFTHSFPFSRLAIAYSWGLTLLFIIIGRGIIKMIQTAFLKNGIGRRRLVFIGNNTITDELYLELKKDPSYKILGVIGKKRNSPAKLLGNIDEIEKILKRRNIDEVIQTHSDLDETKSAHILELCDIHHINYRFIPNLVEVRRSNISIETFGSIPIISINPTPLDGWGKVIKRGTDVIGALTGIIILSPILLVTAIAIKVDSKGPILFTKLDDGSPVKRIGQRGKAFKHYKFRSMHPNTDTLRYTKLAKHNTRTGPLVKIKNDPRVTRVGRFIRSYSIDELPQLWNVLIGNMSLVGPRPHLPEEVANYEKHHHFVLTIKPGLTGLPQTSGRSDLDFEDEVKLDRYYIENWSLLLDIKLIIKTIFVVLKGHQE